jgi:hypothetical protein
MLVGLRLILSFGTTERCCADVLCIVVDRITSAIHVTAAAPAQKCRDSMPSGSLFVVTTRYLKSHEKS